MIEDCAFNMQALQSLFESYLHTPEFVLNDQEALDCVKSRLYKGLPMYKLVLVDYMPTQLNGLPSASQ